MGVSIRSAGPEAAAALVPLLCEVQGLHAAHLPDDFLPPTDIAAARDWLASWLGQVGVFGLLAEVPGTSAPVGYAICEIAARPPSLLRPALRIATLHHICVDPAHRRQGIARALIGEAQVRARAETCSRFRATFHDFNRASAALMRSTGLAPRLIVSERKL
ncbi:GNAT family N-acetyltransferase [Mesobaculum littorinae]|uniref:GNAT family N-acetyltransferase n=1 Tax=Mesobaculum littorinae TaxID=2486419 RepID=A0A438AJA0_9RHOB|nr:GNAT family N-acetyltransferase [Mesobaculum littorinae]RVV98739.1 GNAT family N-acetyltransferase [Mesobaculum littorinae]